MILRDTSRWTTSALALILSFWLCHAYPVTKEASCLEAEDLQAEDVQCRAILLQAGPGNLQIAGEEQHTLSPHASTAGQRGYHHELVEALSSPRLALNHTEQTASTREDHRHTEARIVMCVCVCLIAVFGTVHLMHEHDVHLLPESAMVMIFGVVLGLFLKYWAHADFMYHSDTLIHPSEFVSLMLLPPLIFESGWVARRMDFISQLPYILIFAVLGTFMSICVIGILIYETGTLGWHEIKSQRASFIVAAIISATDPVATLGTYSHLKVDPLLNIMVFGESSLNDAIAIVMFHILNEGQVKAAGDNIFQIGTAGLASGLRVLCGSVFVGALVSASVCWMLKHVGFRDSRDSSKKLEILIVTISAYLSFACGEFFGFTGIIATLISGIMMGSYGKPHLSVEGSLLATFAISQMCTVIDAFLFLICGVCAVFILTSEEHRGEQLGCCLMLFCCMGRFCSTLPCGWLCNYAKRQFGKSYQIDEEDLHLLEVKHLFMIWHAGLRGAIALWLSTQVGDWMDELEGSGTRSAVQSAILLVIVMFLLIFGGTTRLCLERLNIVCGHCHAYDVLSKTEILPWASEVIGWLDSRVFAPLLVGRDAVLMNVDAGVATWVPVATEEDKGDVEAILRALALNHRGHHKHDLQLSKKTRERSTNLRNTTDGLPKAHTADIGVSEAPLLPPQDANHRMKKTLQASSSASI